MWERDETQGIFLVSLIKIDYISENDTTQVVESSFPKAFESYPLS